jgi:hypothetical protein
VSTAVECEGAPRDLGRDQGRACGRSLREGFGGLPRSERFWLRLGRPAAGLRRELRRHFPRQAELLAGMAAAAGVPAAWLFSLLGGEGAASPPEIAVAVGGEISGSAALVARGLGGEWTVRRSRPEGGLRSVEVTRPWLAHALVGVNEAGLAVAVVCGGPADVSPLGFASLRASLAAALPTAPLAQDCLQRFATLDACLDWCAGRPGERPATLLFADASGEIAGIEIAPGRRSILRPAEGWLAGGGSPAAREEIGKALRERGRLAGGSEPSLSGVFALADPTARALELGSARYEP